MSLRDWQRNGWLTSHQSSAGEIANLLGIADRDLAQSQVSGLDPDWAFCIAYNAALQCATAALAASGYRTKKGMHHYRAIQSLTLTIGWEQDDVDVLDAFRQKRHASEYEVSGAVSAQEVAEMRNLARRLRADVVEWLKANHPQLLP